MQSASQRRKFQLISSKSHALVPGINKSRTEISDWPSWGERTLPPPRDGSQRCCQIRISFPLPILHLAPLEITPLTCMILFHAKELRGFKSALKMSPVGKYLALKTLYKRVSFSWTRRHTYLPSNASLKWWRSRKPIPPTDFEEHNLSHHTQWIFREFSAQPH